MILWKLLSNKKFVQGNPQEEQKRVIVEVPADLARLKKRIEDAKQNPGKDPAADALVDNAFLDKFTTTSPEDTKDRPRILFSLNGPAVEGMADSIRAYWGEMLTSIDPGVRKLALDLFKYNMYTSGFGYGMYEFAHFAPFSVMMQTPGYIEALRDVTTADWKQDESRTNFIHQYILNHWGDSKFLLDIPIEKLPNSIRIPLGFGQLSEQDNSKMWFIPENTMYIIVSSGDQDNKTQILYRLDRDSNGVIHPKKAEKLGVRLRGNQVTLQYNPTLNYWEVKPVVAGNDSSWGVKDPVDENNFGESDYNASLKNSNYTRGYVNSLGALRAGISGNVQVGSGFAASLGLIIPTESDVNSMDNLEKAAIDAQKEFTPVAPPPTAEDMPVEQLAEGAGGFISNANKPFCFKPC